jgi:uncharacterized protein (TIGR02147 family)
LDRIDPNLVASGHAIVDNPDMLLETATCKQFLGEELARRIRVNSRYSQRAFARQMGLSAGELSEILRGKRALSLRSALRVASALGLSPAETRHLITLAQLEKSVRYGADLAIDENEDVPSRQKLTLEMFHVVSDWVCFAILNLADTKGFRLDPAWIAKRLAVSQAEAQVSFDRLERVGLIERVDGLMRVTPDYVISPSGIPSEAIRNYHRQILKKAGDALDLQAMTEREFIGSGFATDPSRLPELKKAIARFQEEMVTRFSCREGQEVYHLEIALFRLSEPVSETAREERPMRENNEYTN